MKPPLTNLDPFKIFEHARRFQVADRWLRLRSNPDALFTAQPTMVLSVLASELYLKCLCCIDSGLTPIGHELDKLFAGLPDMRKQRLIELWDDNVKRHGAEFDFHDRLQGVKIPRDLPTALALCNRSFETLRYMYEDPTKVTFYMHDLPDLLKEAILEIHPAWRA